MENSAVVVTGNEFGDFDLSNKADVKKLSDTVLDWYSKNLQGNFAVSPVLGEIMFTGIGKRELSTIRRNPQKLLLVKYLRELISTSREAERDVNLRDDSKKAKMISDGWYFHYVYNVFFDVKQSANYRVRIIIAEDPNGQRFYDLSKARLINKNTPSSSVEAHTLNETATQPENGATYKTSVPSLNDKINVENEIYKASSGNPEGTPNNSMSVITQARNNEASTEKSIPQPYHGKYRLIFLLRDAGEGGAERSSLRLANALARRGHEVRVFFLKAEGPMLSGVDNKIEIVDLKGSFFNFFSSLRARRADFLLPVYTSMRALMAKRFMRSPEIAGMKVILSQRNMFTMDRGPIQTRLKFLRCSLLYPYASAVVCISRGVADEMKTLGLTEPRKIRVIYNPVLNDDLSAQIDAPPDHPWFAAGEPPVLLGVGRLGDQKDFASLIRAFGLLAPKNPDLRLMILGEGKERGRLESLLREMKLTERASLPGYAPNPYPYMKRAALFVLTSRFEGFGNVVAEALACGCNVVSTDCKSGPAEILDGGKYGRLAKVGDEYDIARAIEEALSDPIDANLLRERAAFFSEERAVNEYERLFDELRV